MKGFIPVWRAFMQSNNRTAFLNGVASVAPDIAAALSKQKHRHDEDELRMWRRKSEQEDMFYWRAKLSVRTPAIHNPCLVNEVMS